ncbi:SHOCT domain-containing protein [Zunongwangia sp. F260]|uniref:SHOCT domain-containing protein n=1 Tax=Autumnicola lenta TaxID=3075593 RepID=A0ABU3CIZ3_9FLAO|nr:SHOCT domain-containing protein [Zunongwangia sp. F260]MDT0646327.1 SHOCT domain-containing protein [Zunongwangia sp. F260]
MIIIILWIIFSFLIGAIASNKKVGFWGGTFLSLLLSPLIGLIIALVSSEKSTKSEATKYLIKADKEMRQGSFQQAIQSANTAVNLNNNFPLAYYRLATLHSIRSDKESAFLCLEKAVSLGYSNFDKLNKDPNLEWLRRRPEWEQFRTAGYKKTSSNSGYINELNELSNLRDKGIITEDEFIAKKQRILNETK